MSCFTREQLNKISNLVKEIEQLSDIEKLLLYLQLPCGQIESTEGGKLKSNGKHNLDLLSKKPDQETTQTYTWILSHLEEDPNVSLPKQEVYDEYKAFCQVNGIEPLCVADFGKAMKHAFPCIKPRRLGQRGNSKYCYSGLRKKYKIQPPSLPDLIDSPSISYCSDSSFMLSQQQHQSFNQTIEVCSPTTRSNNTTSQLEVPAPDLPATTSHLLSIASDELNQQQQQQQQQQVNYSCCEAMNLKIEPPDPEQNQHHFQQQQQQTHNHQHHHSTMSHCDNDRNGPYATIQHPMEHKLGSNNDNMTQNGGSAGSVHPTQPQAASDTQAPLDGPQAGPSNSMNRLDLERQQQLPIAPYGSSSSASTSSSHLGRQSDYDYVGALQRFGTPDDDDYKHNYQDLNRPIVGEFSYLTPQQEQEQRQQPGSGGVFIYEPAAQSSDGAAQHHHSQSIHHNPLHLIDNGNHEHHLHHNDQHHVVASSPSSKTSAAHHVSRLRLNLNLNLPVATNNPCRNNHAVTSASSTTSTPMTSSPTQHHPQQRSILANNSNSNGHNHLNDQNHNQYQANGSDVNGGDGSTSNNGNHNTPNPHLQHLHLANICTNATFNNGSCYDSRLNSSSIDCCASPFQSPASTPYPMISNFASPDVSNYYSNDCMGYSDQ